jgi:hypothetical protein
LPDVDRPRLAVFGDEATRAYDRTLPNRDAGEHDGVCANESVPADTDVRPFGIPVLGGYRRSRQPRNVVRASVDPASPGQARIIPHREVSAASDKGEGRNMDERSNVSVPQTSDEHVIVNDHVGTD